MTSDKEWYFAYGSNLKKERLRCRVGEWKKEQKASLRGYILTFAKGYDGHTSGKANIKSNSNSEVKGIVYLITEKQFCKLDACEGVCKGVYRRTPVTVESEGKSVPATTYTMVKEICPLKPSADYLDLILEGLREHGYDENSIEEVR